MINHIIFDMDGVLIDSEPEYKARTRRFLEAKGFKNIQFADGKREFYREQPIDIRKLVNREIYMLLEYLKERNFHIGLASSSFKDTIIRNLTTLEIQDYFEVVVSGMDFKHSKPDPEIYHHTIRQMNVAPNKCLVVEDSTYGIIAAKAAGAIVICKKDERFGYDQSQADYQVESLAEIRQICESFE